VLFRYLVRMSLLCPDFSKRARKAFSSSLSFGLSLRIIQLIFASGADRDGGVEGELGKDLLPEVGE